MRKIYLAFMPMLMLVLNSCTSNNGDIGDLFGMWRVENIEVHGQDVDLTQGGVLLYTIGFQNSTMVIFENLEHQQTHQTIASWARKDDTLIFNFDNTQANGNNNVFTPPAIFGFKYGEQCHLKILKETNNRLELKYDSPEGDIYIYSLKKTK